MQPRFPRLAAAALAALLWACAQAAPVTYKVDPDHTFPSFEADHLGISVWRGKMNKNSGTVVYDKATGAGTVDITVDLASIDFGQAQLNTWARGADFFDVAKHPQARFQGRFDAVVKGVPTLLVGELAMRGVSRPLTLKVNALKCLPHPMLKRELCGADAGGVFQRDVYGLDAGKAFGFNMDVALRIQAEALAEP